MYFDNEAEEVESGEESEEEIKKSTKKSKNAISDEDDDDEEEEEDENNEKTKEEFQNFIDDNEVDEESEHSSAQSSEKSSESENTELEEEDEQLLKENLNIDNLEKAGILKKRKRIKQTVESSEDEEAEQAEAHKPKKKVKPSKPKVRSEMDELADELAQLEEEDEAEEAEVEEEPMNEEDAENDFIVEDSDEEGGEGGRRREPRKKHQFTDEAQQDALDIFGVNIEELGVYDSDAEPAEYEDEEVEEEYEEEEGEGTTTAREPRKRQRAKAKLEDIFEPAELVKGMLTEADQHIRIEDKPERFMTRSTPVTNEPNESALEKEAEWIFRAAFDQKPSISIQEHQSKNPASTIAKIREVLNFIRNEFLEVPFIAFYRKESIEPDLDINDLWRIYELDEKYCQLKSRKENLVKLLQRMQKYQFEIIKEHSELSLSSLNIDESTSAKLFDMLRPLDDADIERVRNVSTNEEFMDAYMHFKLHYACDVEAMRARERLVDTGANELDIGDENGDENETGADARSKNTHRAASKKDRYHLYKMNGINSIAKKFGLSAEQFGENLLADYQRHEIDQWSVDPVSVASEFVSDDRFVSVDQVLAAARYMVAMQLARDPTVRAYVRDVYMKRVTVSVKPTPKGLKEIDENHACYSMKYLREKPVVSFKNEQFLKLAMAEVDGLVEISFDADSMNAISFAQNECSRMPPPEKVHAEDEDFDAPEPAAVAAVSKNVFFESIATMPRQSCYERLKSFYQKDEFSYNVEQWNAQRALILHEVLYKILYPEFEKELRAKLLAEAKEFVKRCCRNKVREWLQVAPYKSDNQQFDDNEQFEAGFRLLAITFSADIDAVAVCACVNPSGDLDEFIRLRKLTTRIGESTRVPPGSSLAIDRSEKIEDFEKLKAFIIEKKPSVIAVAAENKDSLMIIEDIKRMIDDIDRNTTKSEVKHMVNRIVVELVDNELAKVYSATKVAESEFRDQSFLLKQAVTLARQLQDPLCAYAQLCNLDNDVIALKYHPLQEQLSREELLQALQCEFINMVNAVGVDLNRCVRSAHTSNVLQFVSGLGARKAGYILKQAKNKMPVMNRMFLVSDCTLGSRVFINCAGFIRLNVDELAREVDDENDVYTDQLDATRVHPEAYEWARKMAVDALDIDTNDMAQVNSALKEIFENPERLKDLDLDAFAAELKRTGCGEKNITLYDIRAEFYNRYQDPRRQYRPPSAEKFHMLTKETPHTFYTGKMVLCKVTGVARRRPTKEQLEHAEPIKDDNTCTWQCQFCKKGNFGELSQVWAHFDAGDCPGPPVGVRCLLDNQLSGFISLGNLSDKRVANPEDRVKVGQTIYARIVKIDIDRFSVDLTCKTSDLRDVNHKWRPVRDDFYDEAAENEDVRKVEEKKRREEHRQTYTNRVIAHPQFHNIGYQQAVAMLKSMNVGDAIIRPSSKGTNHLTVTWKVADEVYQHIDVLEEKKINEFSLGKRLIIDGEDFEDLDEILARHVSVMAGYVQEILNHKNYKDMDSGKLDAVESVLLNEQRENANRIPYCFICDRNHPGRFIVSYIVKLKARHEIITVTADGFKFRAQLHKNFNALINWFKKNFNDPVSLRASQHNNVSSSQVSSVGGGSQPLFTQSQVPYSKDSSAPYTPSQATPYNNNNNNNNTSSSQANEDIRENSPPRNRDRGFGGRGGSGGGFNNNRFGGNNRFRGNGNRGGGGGGSRGGYGGRSNEGSGRSGNYGGGSNWSERKDEEESWDTEPVSQKSTTTFAAPQPVPVSIPMQPPPAPIQAPAAANADDEMWD